MEFIGDNIIPFRARNSGGGAASFLDLAHEWLTTEGARLVAPENERRHIEHMRPLWALSEETLRPLRVKELMNALLQPAGPLCPASVNKVVSTGRRIIREAQINDQWRGANPFEVVRRLRETKPTHRTLSLAECRALLPSLRADRRREVLTMLYLGPRPGEWMALRKEDVNLTLAMLTIRRSHGRDATKTGKVRTVPIPGPLLDVLGEAMALSPSGLVFPGRDGKRQRADTKLSRMLRDALRRAGVVTGYRYSCRRKGCGHKEERAELLGLHCPACNFKLWARGMPPHVRYYDLRHSAASLHREAGCDPLVIQLALGHAAENLTDSIYTHLSAEYIRRELSKLNI